MGPGIVWIILVMGAVRLGLGSRCERIAAPMCQQLKYNSTVMPNLMGHETQRDAIEGLQEYDGLLEHKCSPFLRLFVCSVFVPFCSEDVPNAVPACRGFCEDVKTDCSPALAALGLDWPEALDCSRFPEANKNLLCMQPPEDDGSHSASEHGGTVPWAPGLVGARHCPRGTALRDGKCLKFCRNDDLLFQKDFVLFEVWSAVWAMICFFFTSFALLTFIIQPKRFRWPARPILYLNMCGFISSTIFLVKWILGPFTCSGQTVIDKTHDHFACMGAALMLLFCEVAFALWWCTFCLGWFLSAAKEWSTEAIEKFATRLHAVVWTLTSLTVVYALLRNDVEINEFAGMCQVNNYLLVIFQLGVVVLGSILAVLTSVALKNVRRALVYLYAGRSPFKLERLICRLGIVSLGICVPLFVCLLCNFFNTSTAEVVRVGLRFLSAVFAALWVFSSKTFKSWNQVLRPRLKNKDLRDIPVTKV